jgi:hypothetical protein
LAWDSHILSFSHIHFQSRASSSFSWSTSHTL